MIEASLSPSRYLLYSGKMSSEHCTHRKPCQLGHSCIELLELSLKYGGSQDSEIFCSIKPDLLVISLSAKYSHHRDLK